MGRGQSPVSIKAAALTVTRITGSRESTCRLDTDRMHPELKALGDRLRRPLGRNVFDGIVEGVGSVLAGRAYIVFSGRRDVTHHFSRAATWPGCWGLIQPGLIDERQLRMDKADLHFCMHSVVVRVDWPRDGQISYLLPPVEGARGAEESLPCRSSFR